MSMITNIKKPAYRNTTEARLSTCYVPKLSLHKLAEQASFVSEHSVAVDSQAPIQCSWQFDSKQCM